MDNQQIEQEITEKNNIAPCSISILNESLMSTIIFSAAGGQEMLKITPDGFYVRGTKIIQDNNESTAVYDAFVAWLRLANYDNAIMP